MVWLIRLLIVLILTAIAVQDFKSRSVYWFWFPMVAALLVIDLRIGHHQSLIQIGQTTAVNSTLLLLIMLLLWAYFVVKRKRRVDFNSELLGWGDVLLLFSPTCYFPPVNYIFFYVFSLIIVVCIFIIRSAIKKPYEQIPLGGFQAMILMICLAVSWCWPKVDLTNDEWIQHFI